MLVLCKHPAGSSNKRRHSDIAATGAAVVDGHDSSTNSSRRACLNSRVPLPAAHESAATSAAAVACGFADPEECDVQEAPLTPQAATAQQDTQFQESFLQAADGAALKQSAAGHGRLSAQLTASACSTVVAAATGYGLQAALQELHKPHMMVPSQQEQQQK
jgi:hypothetical protein